MLLQQLWARSESPETLSRRFLVSADRRPSSTAQLAGRKRRSSRGRVPRFSSPFRRDPLPVIDSRARGITRSPEPPWNCRP